MIFILPNGRFSINLMILEIVVCSINLRIDLLASCQLYRKQQLL